MINKICASQLLLNKTNVIITSRIPISALLNKFSQITEQAKVIEQSTRGFI